MIDYETYKRRFSRKDEKGKRFPVSISQDIYEFFGQDSKFGIAFKNEIALALIEDALVGITTCMKNKDKDDELKSWKKLATVIRDVLIKYKTNDNTLNDRYYQVSASPDERKIFGENPPMIIGKENKTAKTTHALIELGMFYRAMNTEVGEAVCKAVINAKTKAIELLYNEKQKNGTSSYYHILNHIIDVWAQRIALYESYSNNLKLINRSIEYAGRKR